MIQRFYLPTKILFGPGAKRVIGEGEFCDCLLCVKYFPLLLYIFMPGTQA